MSLAYFECEEAQRIGISCDYWNNSCQLLSLGFHLVFANALEVVDQYSNGLVTYRVIVETPKSGHPKRRTALIRRYIFPRPFPAQVLMKKVLKDGDLISGRSD